MYYKVGIANLLMHFMCLSIQANEKLIALQCIFPFKDIIYVSYLRRKNNNAKK